MPQGRDVPISNFEIISNFETFETPVLNQGWHVGTWERAWWCNGNSRLVQYGVMYRGCFENFEI